MAAGGVHHIDLVVSDLDRSLAFYRGLLGPLGYEQLGDIVGERGEPVAYISGSDNSSDKVEIGLREARSEGRHDRYRMGLHHLAFEASSREVVDERLRWAHSQGVEVENDPKEYDYAPGYYAGFFFDPDGIKLEVVHVPQRPDI